MDKTGSGPDLTSRPSLSEPWVQAQNVLPVLTLPLISRCELLRALGHDRVSSCVALPSSSIFLQVKPGVNPLSSQVLRSPISES